MILILKIENDLKIEFTILIFISNSSFLQCFLFSKSIHVPKIVNICFNIFNFNVICLIIVHIYAILQWFSLCAMQRQYQRVARMRAGCG